MNRALEAGQTSRFFDDLISALLCNVASLSGGEKVIIPLDHMVLGVEQDGVDNATDAMRLVAAQDPEGIQSASFEEKRLSTVQVVNRVLEGTKEKELKTKRIGRC